MDYALRRLHLCHATGNAASPAKCRADQRCQQVLAQAAAPLTHSQRALLHTAISRARSVPQQQVLDTGSNSVLSVSNAQSAASLEQAGKVVFQPDSQLKQHPVERPSRPGVIQPQQLHAPQLAAVGQQLLQRPSWHNSVQAAENSTTQHEQQHRPRSPQQQHNSSSSRQDAVQSQQQRLQQQLQLRQLLRQQQQRERQLQLQLRSEPAVLTALIKRSRTWQQLQHLFTTYTAFFNPVHVSAAVTHIAQISSPLSPQRFRQQPDGFQKLVEDLVAAATACVPDYGSRQLANTLWAINRLGFGHSMPRKVQASYLAAFEAKLAGAAPQHISNVALAVSNMGWGTSSQWRRRLLQNAASKQGFFRPQELANFLFTLPQLGAQPTQQWLASFLNTCYDNITSFNSQELSLLGLGLVRLNHQPSLQWLEGYMQAVHVQLDATSSTYGSSSTSSGTFGDSASSKTAQSSNSSSSSSGDYAEASSHLGTDDVSSTTSAVVPGHVAAAAGRPAGFQPQGLANILHVLSTWGVKPGREWQRSCLVAAEHLVADLTIQGASTLVWALARLQISPSGLLLSQVLLHSQHQLQYATSTDMALMAWGLGTLGCTVHNSSQVLVLNHSGGSSTSSSGSGAGLFGSWLSDFMYYSHRCLGTASARDVTCLLVGVLRMRLQPDSRWLQAVAVEAHHRLDTMTAAELTSTLLCLARLRYKPNASFMATFCSCSTQLLSATAAAAATAARQGRRRSAAAMNRAQSGSNRTNLYSPQSLANVLGAMAMLRYQPSQAWVAGLFAASKQLLPSFGPRDFSFTIWALAQLDMQPPAEWMDVFLVQLRQHIPTMDSAQLSATIWGLAKLNHKPGFDWMQRFLDRVVALTADSAQHQQHVPAGSAVQEESADPHAVCTGVGRRQMHSKRMHAAVAPPTVLQLSADFSSIILHGLTMWAVQRLEYSVPYSSRSDDGIAGSMPYSSNEASEPELVLAGVQQSRGEAVISLAACQDNSLCRSTRRRVSNSSIAYVDAPDLIDDVVSSEASNAKATVLTTVTRDGGIVYHF